MAIASLRLTVALFVLAVLLVFFGTLAQMKSGIWTVVDKYFWSEIVWVDFQMFADFGKVFFGLPKETTFGGSFPFVGGRLLGFVMLVNLVAAHAVRFKLTWKRAGIWVLHFGLILLFLGEVGTRGWQVEQRMKIDEGSSSAYAFDTRNAELAFTDSSGADTDRVVVVPASRLAEAAKARQRLTHPDLPVDVEVIEYMVNSSLADPKPGENPATAGLGTATAVTRRDEVSGVDQTQTIDLPSAYVKLYKKGTDKAVGTYLVSLWFTHPNLKVRHAQAVEVDGKKHDLALRFTRYYKPFAMHLIDFRFDRYVGTEKAKNYSSQVRIVDPERGVDREATISMNDPLRYRGETFYQSSFDPETERTTELQVVRNPVWWMPYVACTLVTVGMVVHFGYYLVRFLRRVFLPPAAAGPVAEKAVKGARPMPVARIRPTTQEKFIPWAGFGLLVLLYLGGYVNRTTPTTRLDLSEVARIPVVEGGRIKPLDTDARVKLRQINHTEQFEDPNGYPRPAIQWYLDAASGNPEAEDYRVFRVENDQVRSLVGLPQRSGLRYSFKEIVGDKAKYQSLGKAVAEADKTPAKDRDLYQAKVLELGQHVVLFDKVHHGAVPLLLPADGGQEEWRAPRSFDEKVEAAAAEKSHKATVELLTKTFGKAPQGQEELSKLFEALPKDDQQKLLGTVDRLRADAQAQARAEVAKEDRAGAAWRAVLDAYRDRDQGRLNAAVQSFKDAQDVSAADAARVRFEVTLNELAPFFHCIFVYLMAVLLCLAGWVCAAVNPGLGEGFRRTTFWVLLATFLVHAAALACRMYLMDRPLVFVTNLYSSAVFIGVAAVGLGLLVEKLFPIGVGNFVAAVLGALTTFIAHNLAASGDTLEMMQAVLDTNFWLATHVTTVTLGYSATYVAGLVGMVYLLIWCVNQLLISAGVARSNVLDKPVLVGGTGATAKTVGQVIGMILYGVIALAAVLSFVGTVLGGIWADQSWGRFWGWDPKENGAVLIVVWNALILHARWGGMVKDRGTAVLALVGNMITTWSWFGTNQLGIGLHAYGFDNRLVLGCVVTWAIHLALIATALGTIVLDKYSKPQPTRR
jgi:ABC-type transport system involved in cytochrome c biogenesis permease subunit